MNQEPPSSIPLGRSVAYDGLVQLPEKIVKMATTLTESPENALSNIGANGLVGLGKSLGFGLIGLGVSLLLRPLVESLSKLLIEWYRSKHQDTNTQENDSDGNDHTQKPR